MIDLCTAQYVAIVTSSEASAIIIMFIVHFLFSVRFAD